MKKLIAVLLIVVMLVTVSTTVSAAGATVQNIEFDLEGMCSVFNPETGEWGYVPASAVLTGTIKSKDDSMYLSPLTGIITIDVMEYNILVKSAKQPEPICHYWWEDINPSYIYRYEVYGIFGEANVQGTKLAADLRWYHDYYESPPGNVLWDLYLTSFYSRGIVDGKYVTISLSGPWPIIE